MFIARWTSAIVPRARARPLLAVGEYFPHHGGTRREVFAPPAERRKMPGDDARDIRLAFHAAERAAPATCVDLRRARRVEFLVIAVHEAHLGTPRIVPADLQRVRDGGLHLLQYLFRGIREEYRVPRRLAHFLLEPVKARQAREVREFRFRFRKHNSILVVEPARDLPGYLDVGYLVLADGDKVPLVEQYVGRLEDGVPQVTVTQILDVQVAHLLFDRRIPLEPRRGDQHRQDQVQFGVLFDLRLAEHRAPCRVNARTEPVEEHVDGIAPDPRGVRIRRKRVVVGNQVIVVVLPLERDPALQRPDEVAKVKLAGRTHAAEYRLF